MNQLISITIVYLFFSSQLYNFQSCKESKNFPQNPSLKLCLVGKFWVEHKSSNKHGIINVIKSA